MKSANRCVAFQPDEKMNMIFDAANFLRERTKAARSATEVLVEARALTLFNGRQTILSRKDQVIMQAQIGDDTGQITHRWP
jgi:hypothetical protein